MFFLSLVFCDTPIKQSTVDEQRIAQTGSLLGKNRLQLKTRLGNPFQLQKTASAKEAPKPSDLFQKALDALKSMPLLICDANNGVIVTDWSNKTADERIKVNAVVKDDALTLYVFRQKLQKGQWIQIQNDDKLEKELKEKIQG